MTPSQRCFVNTSPVIGQEWKFSTRTDSPMEIEEEVRPEWGRA